MMSRKVSRLRSARLQPTQARPNGTASFAARLNGVRGDKGKRHLGGERPCDHPAFEWLGGLSVVRHKSKITDRLGPHLDQLVAAGFLASYQINSAKADDCSGFVLGFRPAQGFFDDYER